MSFSKIVSAVLIVATLAACAPNDVEQVAFPTYDPFLPLNGSQPAQENGTNSQPSADTPRPPTPTRVPFRLFPTVEAAASPTPDSARILPTPRQDMDAYVVQSGDTLGLIAQRYGVNLQSLLDANNITNPNLLEVGTTLNIPAPQPLDIRIALKVIPDSELVYGPAAAQFDIDAFIQSQNGYLADYAQDVNGAMMTGTEIVTFVAQNFSVNPRILLALLEYQSGWVTNPAPSNITYPLGNIDANRQGLYRQLAWTANALNRGYYLWKANALSTWLLADGSVIPIDPTINAGTAAVQYFFSQLYDLETWQYNISERGVVVTYFVFFGNPFNYAVEPLIPANLKQPPMHLPFADGDTWYFTGGPHGGWDSGSAWAALDFAPGGEGVGNCIVSPVWVTAMADGLILRASDGAVVQDLDNDGYEQTGWVVLYMHVAAEDRVRAGEYLFMGENVGHPSCEGGVSNATHLHVARKYNGEWISAGGEVPFNLEGWVAKETNIEYNGFLSRNGQTIEAWDGASDLNIISR